MAKKKNNIRGLQRRKALSGYLFISPFIIGLIAFMVKPLIESFKMSLNQVSYDPVLKKIQYSPVLFKNYYNAFRVDIEFTDYLWDEILRMSYYSIAIIVFSVFVAVILNQEFSGRGLVRAIFFLPVILSSGVIVGIETNNALLSSISESIEGSMDGFTITDGLETILRTANIGGDVLDVLFELIDGIYDVALASGIQIIILLSGLQAIPKSSYEAAQIEGCTSWETFWKITFPTISPLFLVCWVYTIVDFCMRTDNEVMEKITSTIDPKLDYGAASAMAWIYFIIVMAILGITSLIISKWVYYDD